MIVAAPEIQQSEATGLVSSQLVCHCHQIDEAEIRTAIDAHGSDSVATIGELTRAGTACGSCQCRLQRMLMGLPAVCGPCGFCTGCNSIAKLCCCQNSCKNS